ncbi:MAG TPA: MBL fold metallo-hydrolase [Flavisolibacter sp.]|jgi:L-ascorbate metabolism protein UlaG (beta-lactamase superfamily)|nr:MBL fold metallo-hydrolase [Flavisolibacter sp.]
MHIVPFAIIINQSNMRMITQHSLLNRSAIYVKILFLFCIFLVLPSCKPIVSLGRNPKNEDLAKIESLPNYQNGQFRNIEDTITRSDSHTTAGNPASAAPTTRRRNRWTGLFKYFFRDKTSTHPTTPIPIMVTDLHTRFEKPTVIWFGHSSALVKTKGANILFDPSFSGFAGPFRGLVNAFSGTNYYVSKDFPSLDAVVISHDHYDHLDYTTIRQLRKKTKRFVVPMGVGSHLRRWGIPADKISEVNWHDVVTINDSLRIISTPAHHRSNRTFAQRKTLWSSYIVDDGEHKIYFSGDTGYSRHFKLIGDQYGPIDLALLECGQYNERWTRSHMFPWQTVRAAQDLRAQTVIPIHWGKFAESTHAWNDPVNRLMKSADSTGQAVSVPYIGEPYSIGDQPLTYRWWDFK